jgi:hypothetical protein
MSSISHSNAAEDIDDNADDDNQGISTEENTLRHDPHE